MHLGDAWRRSPYFRLGFVMLAFFVLIAILQPQLNRLLIGELSPMTQGEFRRYLPISTEHLLGTDKVGRDVLAVMLEGLRHSLAIGALAGLVATLISIVFGFVAGYKGGRIDAVLRTMTDMVLVIPSFPLLVTLAAYIPRVTIPTMALLLALFSWPFAARTIRSQVLSLRERPYIDLATTSNMGDFEIIFAEILPNLVPYLGVGLAVSTAGAMLAEAGLALIGIGLGGGNIATLGLIIFEAMRGGALGLGKWQLVFPPIITLVLIFIALNFINIGLEQAFNPRLRAVTGA